MKTRFAPGLVVLATFFHPVVSHAQWPLDGVALCTAVTGQADPVIVSDGARGAIVAWWDYRSGTDRDIYVQRTDAAGTIQWTADGVALCTAAQDQSGPMIASDGAGGAIVVWFDWRSGTSDIYAQHIDAAGAVTWTPDGVALCAAAGNQFRPTIVADGAGGAIVVWFDWRSGTSDIYAQHIDAAGAVTWTPDGVALCAAAGNQFRPTIVADGAGGAIVAWYDYRNGTDSDIYAQRIDAAGAVQWTANGVAVSTAVGDQDNPMLVSDDAGGAILTWQDARRGRDIADVYAQRIDAAGAVQWVRDGIAVSATTGGDPSNPTIASDHAGGAIVTWTDARGGTNDDVYAQRIDAAGAVQWAPDGIAVSTAAGAQTRPSIASDDTGGAIVTWMDGRSGKSDVYAQRVAASGTVLWVAGGVPLCTAPLSKHNPAIAADGAGGAIATWADNRTGTSHIFTRRVESL